MSESSLASAFFISRWLFPMTFAASAVLMSGARYIVVTRPYTSQRRSVVLSFIPDTIFVVFSRVCSSSFGLIRSGEYPTEKSLPHTIPDSCSRIGKTISSVAPGYIVDSRTTTAPFFRFCPTVRAALFTGQGSGSFAFITVVGTQKWMISASLMTVE